MANMGLAISLNDDKMAEITSFCLVDEMEFGENTRGMEIFLKLSQKTF